MNLPAAVKGQITKAKKNGKATSKVFHNIMNYFMESMPKEQAKHLTRKVLS